MDLSVIIVNYNVRHFLEQCLLSVKKAAEKITAEIIVVDNNSADGSCSMVNSEFPDVKLIINTENKGFSAGCNQGIKNSKGEFILLLNPDTVVEEDTFVKCIDFMKHHPDASALGVRMINGHGKLLPESKRALPTPLTAFFKMIGLSKLFPKSPFLNRYYLGHIDSYETAPADILSGAFMFIRKVAIDKTGPLDETFFMYGEDIDLSYRFIKEGYRNYYYPEVKIIHYKGESTRKGDINYIVHFYKAMLIFVRKHFGWKKNLTLYFLLQIAVYFWGIVAVLRNIYLKYLLPIFDAVAITLGFVLIIPIWENIKFGKLYNYPDKFWFVIPSFLILFLTSIYFSGGYRIPSRIINVLKGLASGVIISLVIYSLLPLELRFSRAVIVLGGLSSIVLILIIRIIFALSGMRHVKNPFAKPRKAVIVCNESELEKIEHLMTNIESGINICGRVSITKGDLGSKVLGNIDQLLEIIRINRIDEIVFSSKELSASDIIGFMHSLSEHGVSIKIAPSGEKLLIGSNSALSKEDLSEIDESKLKFN